MKFRISVGNHPRTALAVLAGLAVTLLPGCGSTSDSATKKGVENALEEACRDSAADQGSSTDCDINLDEGKVKVSTKDGETTYGGTELPSDWPDYLTPEGGEVVSVATNGDGQVVGFSAGDITPKDLAEQAKAAGCTAPEGSDAMGAQMAQLLCEGSEVVIIAGNKMITVSRNAG